MLIGCDRNQGHSNISNKSKGKTVTCKCVKDLAQC